MKRRDAETRFDGMAARTIVALLAAVLASSPCAQAQASGVASGLIPSCTGAQLALSTDPEDGAFDGMSHSGTRLVVRNAASTACRLSAIARLTFAGRDGQPLAIAAAPAAFGGPAIDGRRLPMGHGPVMVPIVLAPHAEAASTLRWVSTPVFDPSRCVDIAQLGLAAGSSVVRTGFAAHVCGPDSGVSIDASPLASKASAPTGS